MLQLLIDGLKSKELYIIESLKNVEHSCCYSSQIVIDFDAVKDAYYRQIGHIDPLPKSCDVLLILPEKNRIVFGEMKQMNLLIKRFVKTTIRQTEEHPTPAAILEHLSDQLRNKYRPDKKIIDSFFLLLEIATYCNVDHRLFPFIISDNCSIECYFVMSFEQQQLLLVENLLRSEREYYRYHKIGNIEFVSSFVFDQIMQISCPN